MKRIYQWILLLFACGNVLAQNNIVQYEYWLDSDYASKALTNISPVQTFNWQTSIPCPDLDVGLHVLNVRFKDSKGQWSSTVSSWFYRMEAWTGNQPITQLEYWLDDNYKDKKSEPLTGAGNQWQTAIDCRALETGMHAFHVRFKDAKGQWSSVLSSYFYTMPQSKDDNTIVAYEYWLDNQFAERKKENANPSAVFHFSSDIPFNELESGLHSFNIRFKDKYGQWSATDSRYFQKLPDMSQNKLVAYEYWLNDLYDEKQTGSISNQQSLVILDDLDIRKAVKATNYIHYRFKDSFGLWSSTLSQDFYRPVEPDFTSIVGLSEVTFTNTSKYADKYAWDFGDETTSTQVNPMHTYSEPGAYEVKLIASNKLFTDSVFHYVEVEGIKKITNNKGGNGGLASFDIYGGGLDENTVVKLVKDGVTISTHTVYKREPGIICATFDLTGKNMGVYDIVIIANGKTYTITDGFEIEEEGWPLAWTELEGNNVFIPGRWQTYTVNYGNAGNTDIYGLSIHLIFSDYAEFEFLFDLVDTVGGENTDINDPDNYIKLSSLYGETFDGKMYTVLIPHIPGNTSGSFSFRMKIESQVASKILVTIGDILNYAYFHTQETVIESHNIFGFELTNIYHIQKEELSQLIRNEINNLFLIPQTNSRKQLINFAKLLNTSNCFSSSLRQSQSNWTAEPYCNTQCDATCDKGVESYVESGNIVVKKTDNVYPVCVHVYWQQEVKYDNEEHPRQVEYKCDERLFTEAGYSMSRIYTQYYNPANPSTTKISNVSISCQVSNNCPYCDR